MSEEDLVDINAPLSEGDEYSPDDYWDDYWAEISYCEFDAMMEQLKHDVYNMVHFGHEDGPEAYAAECLAEEELEQEMGEGAVIDNLYYDEMSAEDMERDAQLETQAMCAAAAAEEAYFKCTL
jgi:hypothetical protein